MSFHVRHCIQCLWGSVSLNPCCLSTPPPAHLHQLFGGFYPHLTEKKHGIQGPEDKRLPRSHKGVRPALNLHKFGSTLSQRTSGLTSHSFKQAMGATKPQSGGVAECGIDSSGLLNIPVQRTGKRIQTVNPRSKKEMILLRSFP